MLRKLKSPAVELPDAESYVATSTDLRTGLQKDALAAVIVLEQKRQQGTPNAFPDNGEIRELAERILTGHRPAIPEKRGSLHQARLVYAAAQLAVELALERAAALRLARARQEAQRRALEWQENRHALAMALCLVRRLEREGDALARQIKGKAPIGLPCESVLVLAGFGRPAGIAREFLKGALREGFITAGELKRELGENERGLNDEFGV